LGRATRLPTITIGARFCQGELAANFIKREKTDKVGKTKRQNFALPSLAHWRRTYKTVI
jgi:hypothetical protein